MNKEKEMIERDIELSTEFSRYLFKHKKMEKKSPSMLRSYFYLNLTKN